MFKSFDKVFLCASSGVIVTMIERVVGHPDKSLTFLLMVMIIDFITGLCCGATEHELSSNICIKGLFKKFFILVYVIIGYQLDIVLDVTYIRPSVCFMYATGEVISIIENGVRLGVPVPEPIEKALQLLNGGDEDEN